MHEKKHPFQIPWLLLGGCCYLEGCNWEEALNNIEGLISLYMNNYIQTYLIQNKETPHSSVYLSGHFQKQ